MAGETPQSDESRQDQGFIVDVSDLSLGDFHIASRSRQDHLTLKRRLGKESNAHLIALLIVITFCLNLFFVFVSYWVVLYDVVGNDSSADLSTVYGMLRDSLSEVGTLFAPLLAFILGYYFNESRNRRDSS